MPGFSWTVSHAGGPQASCVQLGRNESSSQSYERALPIEQLRVWSPNFGLSAWTRCLPSAYRSVFTECFYWMLFTKLTENCSVNRAPSVHRARNDAPVQLRWRASRSLLEQLSMHRPSGTRVQNVYVLTSVTQDVENDSISRFEIGQTVQGVSASTDQRLRSCLSSDEHLPRGRSLRWMPVLDACAGCAPGRSPPRRSWSVTKRGERAFTWLLLIAYYRFIYLIGQHFN